ncbi:CDP-glucose 4,6-dehydratase [Myxococcaceae bacterium]|jgi:CDP-glucose 4,6-dehydratase|nr:CDP-glucose 4,6-dehydratase [Myxococcaceae bacterium]
MTFWSDRRVLVTGCTGFLGAWLSDALVDRGARVTGIVRDVTPRTMFFRHGIADRIDTVQGSIEDYGVLERVLGEYEIDTVFHLAAQALVGVANRNPLATFETNVKGTWNVLEACRRAPLVSRIVLASSDKAYGIHAELPYTEEFPLQGSHPYDVSKSCADLIGATYHHTYRTPVCITRCGNLFGGGDPNTSRIVPGTILAVLDGKRPVIRSDGSPVRDYIHVQEVVDAYLRLAERMDDAKLHGRAFNFGTGEPVSVLDLTRRILRLMKREDLEPEILDEARGEIPEQYLSSDLARRLLDWRPGASLDERLAETIEWYRAERLRHAARSAAVAD